MSARIGITLSTPHLEHLKIPLHEALSSAFSFNFSHIRLGAYWSHIEKRSGDYDFSELTQVLQLCEEQKQKIVMTVGAKAPRWPEFYWPPFVTKDLVNSQTQEQLFSFIRETIMTLQGFNCITHWQVENEPLDPSGPEQLAISAELLQREIELVRSLDSRPIMVNVWGNDMLQRNLLPVAEELADIVGLDIYYKQFMQQVMQRSYYLGPRHTEKMLKNTLSHCAKPIWIAELQAEPWEKNETDYLSDNPGSMHPLFLRKNIVKAQRLPIQEILLWGFEYWLYRVNKHDRTYVELVKEVVARYNT
ncbi:MAG TPA: hypothetical protein VG935_01225 [Patescibacteria group bacterium]|nr:hypothetical protein [Patescibacteria group bacterium]